MITSGQLDTMESASVGRMNGPCEVNITMCVSTRAITCVLGPHLTQSCQSHDVCDCIAGVYCNASCACDAIQPLFLFRVPLGLVHTAIIRRNVPVSALIQQFDHADNDSNTNDIVPAVVFAYLKPNPNNVDLTNYPIVLAFDSLIAAQLFIQYLPL